METHPDLPPEAILWKDESRTENVRGWVTQTHPQAEFAVQDGALLGLVLRVELGVYGFSVLAGQLVMKDKNSGIYSAISVEEYQKLYM